FCPPLGLPPTEPIGAVTILRTRDRILETPVIMCKDEMSANKWRLMKLSHKWTQTRTNVCQTSDSACDFCKSSTRPARRIRNGEPHRHRVSRAGWHVLETPGRRCSP